MRILFLFAIIEGWFATGLIQKSFYEELIDNFCHYCPVTEDEPPWERQLKEKYGRVLR